ncbi:hypothetical protein MKY84_02685 [Chryseomicrobium sp. FSL W7-1435]|uniref:hypothetical protein n=1 Tax=Chryseomicrobium sp. FSL W7-1435 TaxID=2921704 RepID=UPI003159A23F
MKKWFLAVAALGLLAGCQEEAAETTDAQQVTGPAGEIEQKIEEAFDIEVAVPTLQNHDIGLAYLDEGSEASPLKSAHLIYQTTTKPMDGFNVDTWGEQNGVEIIHGDLFKDAPLAELDIFPETYGTIMDSEKRDIAGQEVEFNLIPGAVRDTAFIGFDKEGAGYMIKYHLAENQEEDEAIAFAEQIIEALN